MFLTWVLISARGTDWGTTSLGGKTGKEPDVCVVGLTLPEDLIPKCLTTPLPPLTQTASPRSFQRPNTEWQNVGSSPG